VQLTCRENHEIARVLYDTPVRRLAQILTRQRMAPLFGADGLGRSEARVL
jgi:hypothetical protein